MTPPEMSTLLNLDVLPNTIASVLDGFSSRPFKEQAGNVVGAGDQLRQTLWLEGNVHLNVIDTLVNTNIVGCSKVAHWSNIQ